MLVRRSSPCFRRRTPGVPTSAARRWPRTSFGADPNSHLFVAVDHRARATADELTRPGIAPVRATGQGEASWDWWSRRGGATGTDLRPAPGSVADHRRPATLPALRCTTLPRTTGRDEKAPSPPLRRRWCPRPAKRARETGLYAMAHDEQVRSLRTPRCPSAAPDQRSEGTPGAALFQDRWPCTPERELASSSRGRAAPERARGACPSGRSRDHRRFCQASSWPRPRKCRARCPSVTRQPGDRWGVAWPQRRLVAVVPGPAMAAPGYQRIVARSTEQGPGATRRPPSRCKPPSSRMAAKNQRPAAGISCSSHPVATGCPRHQAPVPARPGVEEALAAAGPRGAVTPG